MTREQLIAIGKAASILRFAANGETYSKYYNSIVAREELRNIADTLTEIENEHLNPKDDIWIDIYQEQDHTPNKKT
jgi:hypothetical protein